MDDSNLMDLEKHRVSQNDTSIKLHSGANNRDTAVGGSPFRILSRQTYYIHPDGKEKDEEQRSHRRRGGYCSCCSPCCCLLTGILLALFLSGIAALIGALVITNGKSTTLTSRRHILVATCDFSLNSFSLSIATETTSTTTSA